MKIDELRSPQLNQNGYHRNTLTKERIGSLLIYPINFTPDDCLSCDGYSLLITDYKELFAVIGTKFNQAGDKEGTFRVPDYNISGRFLQPNAEVGKVIAAGLPNIQGSFISRMSYATGCIWESYYSVGQAYWGNVNNDSHYVKNIDASLSSSVYGNSQTVQPPSQTVHLVIKYK